MITRKLPCELKPKGHGSYITALVGPYYNPYLECCVDPEYGPTIHDIDCSSYRGLLCTIQQHGAFEYVYNIRLQQLS